MDALSVFEPSRSFLKTFCGLQTGRRKAKSRGGVSRRTWDREYGQGGARGGVEVSAGGSRFEGRAIARPLFTPPSSTRRPGVIDPGGSISFAFGEFPFDPLNRPMADAHLPRRFPDTAAFF
jgi:hypothetical protein